MSKLKFLIDTGSNKNYISPKLIKHSLQLAKPKIISNISGNYKIDKFIKLNPFPDISDKIFDFYVFDFHEYFDGLIGYETLQELEAKIDAKENHLKIFNHDINMYKKYPELMRAEIAAQTIQNIEIPCEFNGEFYFEETEVAPKLFIVPGVYNAAKNKTIMTLRNESDYNQIFSIQHPISN